MKPGTSARNSSGTLNALQVWMKRRGLVGRVDEQHPALDLRLVRHETDRAAVEPPEADDDLLGPARVNLEERAAVEQRV